MIKDSHPFDTNEPGQSKANASLIMETTITTHVSPTDILPIPIAKHRTKRLNKRHGKTMVLTSSHVLEQLQA